VADNFTQDFRTQRRNYDDGRTRTDKQAGRLWYSSEDRTIRVSDGVTPGGIVVAGGGSGGGGGLIAGDNVSLLTNDANYTSVGDNLSVFTNDLGFVTSSTNVSVFPNDANYISSGDNVSLLTNDANYTSTGDNLSVFVNDAGYITSSDVPTNLSEFTNDVGFLASGDNVSSLTNDSLYTSEGDNLSVFTNDVGFLTSGDNVSSLVNDANYIALTDLSAAGDLAYNNTTGEFSVTTYKSTDFDADFNAKTTDDLNEGIVNLYFTDGRVDARVANTSISSLLDVDNNLVINLAEDSILIYNATNNEFVAESFLEILDRLKAELEVQYDKLVDEEGTFTYIGEAEPGADRAVSVWRIKRVQEFPDGDIDILWANGTAAFNKSWTDRATYTYQ